MSKIRINSWDLSDIFWDTIFKSQDDMCDSILQKLRACSRGADILRSKAAYNTGSLSHAESLTLFLLISFFKPIRIFEIGTFIGRSTVSMACGIDTYSEEGEIYTCDFSNELQIPWQGKTKIRQFPGKTSTEMFKVLTGPFDLGFLDGRLINDDVVQISKIINEKSIIVLDDFVGIEKGVSNALALAQAVPLKNHLLILPSEVVSSLGNKKITRSKMALFVPHSFFQVSKQ